MVKRVQRKVEQKDQQNVNPLIFPSSETKPVEARPAKNDGGFIESISEREKNEKETRDRERKENEEKRIKLNVAADVILSCLEPGAARDIRNAAKDYKIKNIGIYVLGLINRLVKTVDIFEPDIEVEWESGKVGYSSILFCKYCNTEITKPKNIGQIYCSNRCARRDSDFGKTGVLFPTDHSTISGDDKMDEKKWEQEQRRIGAI